MKCVYLLLCLWGIFLSSVSTRHVQFYRKDYTYIEKFDAFYKMHWDLSGFSWDTAFLACDDEGATLFYPKVKEEWALVKELARNLSKPPNVTEIFIGIHNEFGLGEFLTVDGHSTPYPLAKDNLHIRTDSCILMNIETGIFTQKSCVSLDLPLPFVCKKSDNESCPTVDRGYKYSPVSKKCYKVNKRPKTWQEAIQTCFMEGGILAVIANRAEADVIKDMGEREQTYFVGVRKIFPQGDFYTVKGQQFSKIYRNNYEDRRDDDSRYNCGAVYVDNIIYTTTKICEDSLPFICEMDVGV